MKPPEELVTAIVYLCDPGTSVLWSEAAALIRRDRAQVRAEAESALLLTLAEELERGAEQSQMVRKAMGRLGRQTIPQRQREIAANYRRRAEYLRIADLRRPAAQAEGEAR